MKFIDNLIGKGLSPWIIFQVIALNLAWMVTLAGPMAVLVASLMAFGSLASSNEITIMKGSGLSTIRLLLPVLVVSGLLCYALVLFNNRVLPEANHRTRVLMMDIQRTKPTLVIQEGKFTDDISGYNLLVKKTFSESNNLEGILIIDNSNPNASNVLTAEKGDITFSSDYSKVILNLANGWIEHLNKKNIYDDYRKIKFDKHIVTIDAQGFGFSKSDENALSRGDRELSADSMRNIISNVKSNFDKQRENNLESVKKYTLEFLTLNYSDINSTDSVKRKSTEAYARNLTQRLNIYLTSARNYKADKQANQKEIDMYLVEIYKKYSIPFSCIVFVLIGGPLGIRIRKAGFGIAAGLSLGFFLLYWASLIGGEKLADRELLSPLVAMWSANIVLGLVGIYLVSSELVHVRKKIKVN